MSQAETDPPKTHERVSDDQSTGHLIVPEAQPGTPEAEDPGIDRPFGQENRLKLIEEFFSTKGTDAHWRNVYRLLLWADKTTGLAHCYESDKSQPGKPWYPRSLRFHDWLSDALASTPAEVGDQIDWLFQRVAEDYSLELMRRLDAQRLKAAKQLEPYAGKGFPEPGTDPDIVDVVKDVLGAKLSPPTPEEWRILTLRIREVVALENKRRNMVGEGFEDLLSTMVRRIDENNTMSVSARSLLGDIPGFRNAQKGGKAIKVDLALVRKHDEERTLVTAKWSIRADRERQFKSDFDDYVGANMWQKSFKYVLVTNEFDPARLVRACEQLATNAPLFSEVVHIAPAAIQAAYGSHPKERRMREVMKYIDDGRIIGLDDWLGNMAG